VKRLYIMPSSQKKYYYLTLTTGFIAILFGFSLLFLHTNSSIYRPILFILVALIVLNVIVHLLLKDSSPKIASDQPEKKEEQPEIQKQSDSASQSLAPSVQPVSEERQEELKEETVLANIGEGLVIIDKFGKIITFNKAAQALLGWTEQEALGKNFADIVRIDFENNIDAKKQTLGHQSSLHFVRKDGTKFPAAITTSSYVQGDSILGTITLFRDETAERNNDKMKNEFISLASHQLRTPLAAIKWYSQMLIKGDVGKLLPDQMEYANSIYTSTERMIDLVNSLLNITRIESGRIMVEPKPTDLKKLVSEILDEVKIRYVEKKQKFSYNIHGDIPIINIDPRLIRQVYINLLTNAAKYTSENGQISVTISKNQTDIISEVKDNGFGIPKNEQEKVFNKFYRGENMVNGSNDGTGLGLYLVKAIIALSQGKIWFESEVGKGTTFWLSLPVAGTQAKKGVLSLETQ
jgi:PAS domain S-box-containing protein